MAEAINWIAHFLKILCLGVLTIDESRGFKNDSEVSGHTSVLMISPQT